MTKNFYNELRSSLPKSTGEQRKSWAVTIVEEDIPLKNLYGLLLSDENVTARFLWMISDIGILRPEKLFTELPALFDFMEQHCSEHLHAFASWWHYCGVPEENEAKAIDYLFKWLPSGDINVSIKTRALWVLVELSRKYPDLKQELKICIDGQMDKYSRDFKKRTRKVLMEFNS